MRERGNWQIRNREEDMERGRKRRKREGDRKKKIGVERVEVKRELKERETHIDRRECNREVKRWKTEREGEREVKNESKIEGLKA